MSRRSTSTQYGAIFKFNDEVSQLLLADNINTADSRACCLAAVWAFKMLRNVTLWGIHDLFACLHSNSTNNCS